MDISALKKEQRKEIKEKWKNISREEKLKWDNCIFEKIFSIPQYQKAKVIFSFVSMENEPDTVKIIEKILCDKKLLCVPKCVEKGIMKAFVIESLCDLKEGKYGIYEPSGKEREIKKEEIDFALVPCVSADRNLKRLGHGGGYYDRFMENASFTKVLLSYECLLLDDAASEEHDIRCDYLVTEKEIYKR